MLLAAVMAMVLAAAAPAFAQANAVGGSVQYVDCDQIQAAATGQYNTGNEQDMAGVAQELGVSQNQVLACLGSIAAGRDVNINTASAATSTATATSKAAKKAGGGTASASAGGGGGGGGGGGKDLFPSNPNDLLLDLPRDAKGFIHPSDYVRIRPEQHPLNPGEVFAPRHHGQHYHVEIRLDPTKSWNNKNNVIKIQPPGYIPGHGTGFLPGELFPGK